MHKRSFYDLAPYPVAREQGSSPLNVKLNET